MNSPFPTCIDDFAPNLHLNNPRLHLKSIAIEERGVGPWSSHKKCKFLVHPCQMKFDYINVVPDCKTQPIITLAAISNGISILELNGC